MSTTPPPSVPLERDPADKEYVLGTDDDELWRLGFQHQVWRSAAGAIWERAGLGAGQRVIDVGAGPGWATFDLAYLVGSAGHVTAVDLSPRFVAHLRAEVTQRQVANVDVLEADVQRFALPDASYDGAYARWVLCFVPDPEAVVAAVAAAVRPGGFFAIQDYVNYEAALVAPPSPIFEQVIRATRDSWQASGGDPRVGLRLPALLERQGFTVREVAPLQRCGRPGTMLWHWPTTFFRNFLPVLEREGRISAAERAGWMAAWEERSRDPAAFFLTPPMVDVVAVRR
jgi:ubiquinone/menaquinone biosynthesis C-methylase UbiE